MDRKKRTLTKPILGETESDVLPLWVPTPPPSFYMVAGVDVDGVTKDIGSIRSIQPGEFVPIEQTSGMFTEEDIKEIKELD